MKQYKQDEESMGVKGKIFPLRGKWLAVCSVLLVLVIIGTGSYFITEKKLSAVESTTVVEASPLKKAVVNKAVVNSAVVIKQYDSSKKISKEELAVYNKMHKMINTKIVAEDGKIWGEVAITPEKCQALIKDITKSGYSDKDTLIQFLARWKDNNFSSGVDEHNYLWDGLDGTIGKAESLRP
ncbi:DUF6241 domain-containing protein [Clostridium lacusfryxellense]|uniref:DUF6241 domain-containing protein n=1 Tax=Clostridium lacusfryxellense TaxID=205328 RepID=UPI001C0C7744|nr:DUF6241 domain-containing protein [Clostridium lacusfryxellense]MBU3110983.1 hypothetical protein [Clostridium lacusfryxellense]